METKIEDGCACQLNKHREGRFLRAVPLQIEPNDGYQQSLQEIYGHRRAGHHSFSHALAKPCAELT